jgi:streptogramin lyase
MSSQIDDLDREVRELLRRKADRVQPIDNLERTLRRSDRRVARNLTALLLVVGLAVAGGIDGLHSIAARPRPAVSPPITPLPPAGTLAARIPLTGYPVAVSVGEGAVWALSAPRGDLRQDRLAPTSEDYRTHPVFSMPEDPRQASLSSLPVGTVTRIDPTTNQVSETIDIGGVPFDMVAAYGAVWVADLQQHRAVRIDPGSNTATDVPLPTAVASVTAAAGSLWFASYETSQLFRVDPVTQAVIGTIRVGDNGYKEVRSFDDAIWVAYQGNLRFAQVDPATNRVTAEVDALVGNSSAYPEFAVGDGRLWVVSVGGPATVRQLDPASDTVVAQTELPWDTSVEPVGGAEDIRVVTVRATSDSVWAAMTDVTGGPGQATRVVGRLLRIDPDTNRAVSAIEIEAPGTGTSLIDLAVDGQSVWLIDARAHELVRVGGAAGT